MKEALILFILSIPILIGLSIYLDSAQCQARAKALGYSCSYGPLQGCIMTGKTDNSTLIELLRRID